MLFSQRVANLEAGGVFLVVKKGQPLEVERFISLLDLCPERLVQSHHCLGILPFAQGDLGLIDVGIRLRIRAKARLANRKHAENKSEET